MQRSGDEHPKEGEQLVRSPGVGTSKVFHHQGQKGEQCGWRVESKGRETALKLESLNACVLVS